MEMIYHENIKIFMQWKAGQFGLIRPDLADAYYGPEVADAIDGLKPDAARSAWERLTEFWRDPEDDPADADSCPFCFLYVSINCTGCDYGCIKGYCDDKGDENAWHKIQKTLIDLRLRCAGCSHDCRPLSSGYIPSTWPPGCGSRGIRVNAHQYAKLLGTDRIRQAIDSINAGGAT